MPIRCFVVGSDDRDAQDRPGAMWFVEPYGPGGKYRDAMLRDLASAEYKRDWADKRAPICVRLPDGTAWNVDTHYGGRYENDAPGWTITGEAPRITAHPSVNVQGSYHGWLTDGVLSDDLDGRIHGQDAPR